jgi:uncharacterized metal-binding protein
LLYFFGDPITKERENTHGRTHTHIYNYSTQSLLDCKLNEIYNVRIYLSVLSGFCFGFIISPDVNISMYRPCRAIFQVNTLL